MINFSEKYNRKNFENFLEQFLPDDLIKTNEELKLNDNNIYFEKAILLGEVKSLKDLVIIEIQRKRSEKSRISITKELFKFLELHSYSQALIVTFSEREGHYRFSHIANNMTPWKQLYFTWWRMPDQEFNVYHRFRPYFLLGQLDYSKEILIPQPHPDSGVPGYNVINPLYCYEGGKTSFKELFAGNQPVRIDRSAIIVNRGWIPANLKDKRARPTEINTR